MDMQSGLQRPPCTGGWKIEMVRDGRRVLCVVLLPLSIRKSFSINWTLRWSRHSLCTHPFQETDMRCHLSPLTLSESQQSLVFWGFWKQDFWLTTEHKLGEKMSYGPEWASSRSLRDTLKLSSSIAQWHWKCFNISQLMGMKKTCRGDQRWTSWLSSDHARKYQQSSPGLALWSRSGEVQLNSSRIFVCFLSGSLTIFFP